MCSLNPNLATIIQWILSSNTSLKKWHILHYYCGSNVWRFYCAFHFHLDMGYCAVCACSLVVEKTKSCPTIFTHCTCKNLMCEKLNKRSLRHRNVEFSWQFRNVKSFNVIVIFRTVVVQVSSRTLRFSKKKNGTCCFKLLVSESYICIYCDVRCLLPLLNWYQSQHINEYFRNFSQIITQTRCRKCFISFEKSFIYQ